MTEIENLQDQINRIEGQELLYNIGNRVYGLGKIGFQVALAHFTDYNPWSLLYLPLALDGLADLATGKHHTLMFRLLRIHPKYKLERIVNNQS